MTKLKKVSDADLRVGTDITKINRRILLGAVPAVALMATGASANAVYDPIPEWFEAWTRARNLWDIEARRPDGGNFDTPECLRQEAIFRELDVLISSTQATTPQGAAKQIEWVMIDGDGDISCALHKTALENAVIALKAIAGTDIPKT